MSDRDTDTEPTFASTVNPALRPDKLALTSWLKGGPRPSTDAYRVLELGCGEGTNLLPLAFYRPDCRFVGLDPSTQSLAAMQEAAGEVGVTNLRLEACTWQAIPSTEELGGPFDYIILFNRFPWLEQKDRAAVLDACARLLAPTGVAYIDTISPEGWAIWPLLRRLMGLGIAGSGADTRPERVQRARETMAGLAQITSNLPATDPHYVILAGEIGRTLSAPVAEFERALFQEPFLVTAAGLDELVVSHGLRRVCEADLSQVDPRHRDRVQLNQHLANSGLAEPLLEAVTDAFTARRMRSAILSLPDAPASTLPTPADVRSFFVASDLEPVAANVNLASEQPIEFKNGAGAKISSNSPLLNAALIWLRGEHPRGVPVGELLDQIGEMLVRQGMAKEIPAAVALETCEQLLTLHRQGVLELRLWEPPLPATDTWRPNRLARFQVRQGPLVTTPLHTPVALEPVGALTFAALGETPNVEAAISAIVERAVSGDLPLTQHGMPLRGRQRIEAFIRERVGNIMMLLQQWGLVDPS